MTEETRKAASKHFGNWLVLYMIDNEISGKKLSASTGFHANVIGNWRSGRCQPNGYSLAVLATALSRLTDEERSKILDKMATALMWA